jgi:hypothetical protein
VPVQFRGNEQSNPLQNRCVSHMRPQAAEKAPVVGRQPNIPMRNLVQGKPRDVVGSVTIVAVGRLPERAGKLPFLGLVAPLNRGVAKNVV